MRGGMRESGDWAVALGSAVLSGIVGPQTDLGRVVKSIVALPSKKDVLYKECEKLRRAGEVGEMLHLWLEVALWECTCKASGTVLMGSMGMPQMYGMPCMREAAVELLDQAEKVPPSRERGACAAQLADSCLLESIPLPYLWSTAAVKVRALLAVVTRCGHACSCSRRREWRMMMMIAPRDRTSRPGARKAPRTKTLPPSTSGI